ncbi:hypothetical protein AV654_19345 [Paenibacillus elgii]|uniref:Uncharacterized protein n=1 Tax=Paenibacillus elgii TaxID=189691 RepID=A0A165R2U1_9BACL|nr:hypothetical protein AV654_19345 [Paenibacillus elgii]
MIEGEWVRVVGDSVWWDQCGEVVEVGDDGFVKIRFSIWGNVRIARIWANYLRVEPKLLWKTPEV